MFNIGKLRTRRCSGLDAFRNGWIWFIEPKKKEVFRIWHFPDQTFLNGTRRPLKTRGQNNINGKKCKQRGRFTNIRKKSQLIDWISLGADSVRIQVLYVLQCLLYLYFFKQKNNLGQVFIPYKNPYSPALLVMRAIWS